MLSGESDNVPGNEPASPAPMSHDLAQSLISFANAHDDGSPQPRAYYDSSDDTVVVTSTEYVLSTRKHRLVQQRVRCAAELRALLGY
jgi:hypothetical protein